MLTLYNVLIIINHDIAIIGTCSNVWLYLTLTIFLTDQIVNVTVSEVSDTTAIITLTCGSNRNHVQEIMLLQEGTDIRDVGITCNISTTISGLVSGRVYDIVRKYNHQITCNLTSFNTTPSKSLNHYFDNNYVM